MAIGLSTGLAQQQTQALADAFQGGFLRIFSGARPASPDAAETGTLLGIATVNGQAKAGLHFTATPGLLSKASEQWQLSALVTGTATWFRLVAADDEHGDNDTAVRIDGTVGDHTSSAALQFDSAAFVVGRAYTVDNFAYLIQPRG